MPHASKFVLALAFDRIMLVPILKIRLDMFKITIDGKILVLTVLPLLIDTKYLIIKFTVEKICANSKI